MISLIKQLLIVERRISVMEQSYTAENITSDIEQFYQGSQLQAEIHQRLTAAQVSLQAWKFVWELLDPTKAVSVNFFAANTLHLKISRYWHELREEDLVMLKTNLMTQLYHHRNSHDMVRTRLCSALSAFAMYTIPDHWTNCIQDIMESYRQMMTPETLSGQGKFLFLDVLAALPEELNSTFLPKMRKGIVRNELQKGIATVMQALQDLLNQQCPKTVKEQLIHCFSSWIFLGFPLVDYEPLVVNLLALIKEEELCDHVNEALVSVLTHHEAPKYPASLYKFLCTLLDMSRLLNDQHVRESEDICSSIYKILVTMGESHSRLLLDWCLTQDQKKENAMKLVSLIMQCSALPGYYPVNETCSELPFGFWYILQDDILSTTSQENLVFFLETFRPVYIMLINIFLVKVQYPPDEEYQQWSSEEKEQLRCYRQDIVDTLMYTYNLLQEHMLDHMSGVLRNVISTPNADWRVVEACLLVFDAIANSVEVEEQKFLPQLFLLLPTIPYNNMNVVATALEVIGSYSEWISYHPDVLDKVIPLLLIGLNNGDVALSASMSLKDLTRECQYSLQPFADQIFQSCQAAITGNVLKARECIRLMGALGSVLATLPFQTIMTYLNTLLTPLIEQLNELLNTEPSRIGKTILITKISMLAMLFGNLYTKSKPDEDDERPGKPIVRSEDEPQPVLLVVQQVMALLKKVASLWVNDAEVIDALCDLLKKTVSTLMGSGILLVEDINEIIIHLYLAQPNPAVLDLVKQLLILYSSTESIQTTLRNMFLQITNATFALCEKGMAEFTDIMEKFTSVLAQLLKKNVALLNDPCFDMMKLFHTGVMALCLAENATVKAASQFLVEFITQSPQIPLMVTTVKTMGEYLVGEVLQSIGGRAPRSVIDYLADILMVLNKFYFEDLCQWLNNHLLQPDFPSPLINQEGKNQFSRNIMRERVNKRQLRDIVKDFTLMCRGLMGTEYAAQGFMS